MKFFVVADVHGFYDELIEALDKQGFDINNPEHIFVSCGDLLDRGSQAKECLDFVNSLPYDRRILIKGNHEDLLDEAIHRGSFMRYDYANKTNDTVYQLSGIRPDKNTTHNWFGADQTALMFMVSNNDWKQYLNSCVDFYETDKYIFVHGWIPYDTTIEPTYIENWREHDWKVARWFNGMLAWKCGVKEPNKTIVCGHWHCSYGHCNIHNNGTEFKDDAIFTPFIDDGIIALDACTAHSGFINCVVLEDN